jgi:hypothetical protein
MGMDTTIRHTLHPPVLSSSVSETSNKKWTCKYSRPFQKDVQSQLVICLFLLFSSSVFSILFLFISQGTDLKVGVIALVPHQYPMYNRV